MRYITLTAFAVLAALSLLSHTGGQERASAGLRGRVVDLFGSPVADARVEVLTQDKSRRFEACADKGGGFSFDGLPAARLTLLVNAQGFARESLEVALRPAEQAWVEVGLEAGRLTDPHLIQVSGTVRQAGGKPLPGASVTLVSAYNRRIAFSSLTDRDGRYHLAAEAPGQYLVYASKPGSQVSATSVTLSPKLPRESYVADLTLRAL